MSRTPDFYQHEAVPGEKKLSWILVAVAVAFLLLAIVVAVAIFVLWKIHKKRDRDTAVARERWSQYFGTEMVGIVPNSLIPFATVATAVEVGLEVPWGVSADQKARIAEAVPLGNAGAEGSFSMAQPANILEAGEKTLQGERDIWG